MAKKKKISDAATPANLPLNPKVVDPEIPRVDVRRYEQVMRVAPEQVDEGVKALKNSAPEKPTPSPLYPFTAGIQLTNDGVGFGEEIIETRVPSSQEKRKPATTEGHKLRFRRTRSGKVPTKDPNTLFMVPSGRNTT